MHPKERATRREVLRFGAAGAVGLAASSLLTEAASAARSPYGPFKMGIQSYSLRGYGLDEALHRTQELGLHYWEAFPAHVALTRDPSQIAELQRKFRDAGVRLVGYGVIGFGANQDENRRTFEAAKAMGIQTLSADPDPKAFDQLDRLVDEFRIDIAIHNHGPRHRWGAIAKLDEALKGHHPRLGVCVDTGHYLHSREDPVRAIETFGPRVHDVHLKDMRNAQDWTVVGQGDLNLVGVLRALRSVKYDRPMQLEYEEKPSNPMADIEASLAAVREAVLKV